MSYSKYRAKPTVVDGVRFASKAEAKRYGELLLLERAGQIQNLRLQTPYPLSSNGQIVAKYLADFDYDVGDVHVAEDVKGIKTDLYSLKRKMFIACYPHINHREITSRGKR